MKTIVLKKNGGVENLVLKETERPTINDTEVLIHNKAVSINPVDVHVRKEEGGVKGILKPKGDDDNIIIGWDVAGTVVEVGKNVSDFRPGDDVFGMINFPGHGKGYAEYVAAPADQLSLKPGNVSFEEAAGATLAALTAYQALIDSAQTGKGDKVLIHAAAGGVGHYAVQIAKILGAYVIGTGSSVNREFIESLGADEFIDYHARKFDEVLSDVDVVLDSVGQLPHLERSLSVLKDGGHIISIRTFFDDRLKSVLGTRHIKGERILVKSDGKAMRRIADWLQQGKLKSHISNTYAFGEIGKSHEQIETGRTRGKVVVRI